MEAYWLETGLFPSKSAPTSRLGQVSWLSDRAPLPAFPSVHDREWLAVLWRGLWLSDYSGVGRWGFEPHSLFTRQSGHLSLRSRRSIT